MQVYSSKEIPMGLAENKVEKVFKDPHSKTKRRVTLSLIYSTK